MRSILPRASSFLSHIPTSGVPLKLSALFLAFFTTLASTLAWKITDVDFAAKMGVKHLPEAYGLIALLLILFGIKIGIARTAKPAEAIFLKIQEISWKLFLILWLIELQNGISSIPLGIFGLKVLGHVYSSLTMLSFWIIYDPYDPFAKISKNTYTFLIISGYLGMASSGFVFNALSHAGASSFIPVMGILSFAVWLLARICGNKKELINDTDKKVAIAAQEKSSTFISSGSKLSRSALFLICGSVLLNTVTASSEYSVIADFEQKFFSNEGVQSMKSLGRFLTIFGLGNLLALISSTMWYSVRLQPMSLLVVGGSSLLVLNCGHYLSHIFPWLETISLGASNSSMITAGLSLLLVESIYPLVVQSNMMNVLSALPISSQRQARAIIESSAEALGLTLSAMVMDSASSFTIATVGMCFVTLMLSGFLFLREKRIKIAQKKQQPVVETAPSPEMAPAHLTALRQS